jgi:trimeric autotransporter adhesin
MKNRNKIFTTLLLALVCFGFSPGAPAVQPTAPDTGLAGGNTADGDGALAGLTGGFYNSAFGFLSLLSNADASFNTGVGAGALLLNTANENTATGAGALFSNTTGGSNTANGAFALFTNSTGSSNTAIGTRALMSNTGDGNTAVGQAALIVNTIGTQNTVVGAAAAVNNTEGSDNTAIGLNSLFSNVDGDNNTAVGRAAMGGSTGSNNTAVGWFALEAGGSGNTAVGSQALQHNTGGLNTAVGENALVNSTIGGPFGVNANTAVGESSLSDCTTGFWNVAIGFGAGHDLTTGDTNVYIGQGVGAGAANESGHTYIRNIKDTSVNGGGADFVTVDLTTGLLGHASSSRRHKEDIKPMDNASEALYRLKPVSYRYKKEIDRTQSPAFGLIAEEVAEVNPDLVALNAKGEVESVHYEMVNAMLLNEFLKEHKKVQAQQASITELQSTVAQQQKGMNVLTAQLKEQAAQIQKVSARLEVIRPAPKTVANK